MPVGLTFNPFQSRIQKHASTASLQNRGFSSDFSIVNGQIWINISGSPQLLSEVLGNSATTTNIGTKNGATVSVVETGDATTHKTVLTLAATPLTLSDTNVGGGVLVYTFPVGAITILGAVGSLAETTTSVLASTLNAGVTYNWGVGSVITTTQASGTLATTQQDLLPTTNGVASATISVPGAASKGIRIGSATAFNGNSSALVANFNVGIATATDIDGDATTLWSGTITLNWLFNGAV